MWNYLENNINYKYLEENKGDLNNAIVVINNNDVYYLLYQINNFIIIRKFPNMIMNQTIQLEIINKCFIIENTDIIFYLLILWLLNIKLKKIN